MGTRANALMKLLEEGGEGARRAIATLRGQAPTIAREAEEVIVEDPRLVTQAASRVLPDIETSAVTLADDLMLPPPTSMVDDIVEAVPTPATSNLARNVAIGAGAGGLGLMALDGMDGGSQPPVTTAIPRSIVENANRQLPKGTKPDVKPLSSAKVNKTKDTLTDAFKESISPTQETTGKAPGDDFDAKLLEARSKDVDKDTLFGLLRASQQAGSALANTKADTSFADMNLEEKNKYVNQLTADQALKSKRKEETDEDILRDPNSDISKQARSIAAKVGLKIGPNVTAQQLKTAGLPIGNLLTQHMAIEARKEQAALAREALAASKADKEEIRAVKANIDERDKIDKMVGNFTKSDDYKSYQAAKTAKTALDNALVENNKTAIGSGFMMYAKIAQGDNSVVRESDMKNLAGSYNYSSPAEMISKLATKAKGADFTPLELKQMRQVADIIERTKAKHIQHQLTPIKLRFEKYGLDPAESISSDLVQELTDAETQVPDKSSELTTVSKKAKMGLRTPKAPNSTITDKKTGKQFRVNQDGMSATEI